MHLNGSTLLPLVGGTLRLVGRLSPAAGSRLAFEVFCTPRRFRMPNRERALLAGAERFEIPLGSGTRISAWRWGGGGRPAAILMHGWEGRGAQMAAFARPLVDAGFSVVAFDAPGHGRSTGRTSSLPHFTWALRGVAEAVGGASVVVAHSLGCAAATLAMRDGLQVGTAVFLAPPLRPADYTQQFGAMFRLTPELVAGLQSRVEERFLRKWDDYSLAAIAPAMTARLLIVHDRHDDETLWSGGARLAELWSGARLITTEGLGHRRILREASVIGRAVEFASNER